MRKFFIPLVVFFFVVAVVALVPSKSLAWTVEYVSSTPEVTDISTMLGNAEDDSGAAEAQMFLFLPATQDEQEYTMTFSVEALDEFEEAIGAVTMGSEIVSIENNITVDGTVTITTKYLGGLFTEEGEKAKIFLVAIFHTVDVEAGEDGPPIDGDGLWMSTNCSNWEMIPPGPQQETPQFGFRLTGPEGSSCFFKMFLPQGLIDLLSYYTGQTLDIQDLAVFVDDEQASMDISEVEEDGVVTGALIDINVTFEENVTEVLGLLKKTEQITKSIVAREALALSLAAKKSSLKEGKKTTLFGWLKNRKKGEKVTLYQKVKGEKKYTKVTTLTTKKDGYYSYQITPSATAKYIVKYRSGKKLKTSDFVQVKVK